MRSRADTIKPGDLMVGVRQDEVTVLRKQVRRLQAELQDADCALELAKSLIDLAIAEIRRLKRRAEGNSDESGGRQGGPGQGT